MNDDIRLLIASIPSWGPTIGLVLMVWLSTSTILFFRLRDRFRWTLHNLVGHPAMEMLHLLGWAQAADWVHDVTLPRGAR